MSNEYCSIICPNCGAAVVASLKEVKRCPGEMCGYLFKAFSKRKKQKAESFFAEQPSIQEKFFVEAPDGRWVVAYWFREVERVDLEKLSDVIPRDILEILQGGLCEKLNRPWTIIEFDGKSFFRIEPFGIPGAKPTRRCSAIRNLPKGNAECIKCDEERYKKFQADPNLKAHWYKCWAGLVDFAVPIFINEILVGVFLAGQVRRNDEEGESYLEEGIEEVKKRLKIDEDKALELLGLAFEDPDVLPLTKEELDRRLRDWVKVVSTITSMGEMKYIAERQLRDREFLDEIFARLEVVRDEEQLWKVLRVLLERINEYHQYEASVSFSLDPEDEKRLILRSAAGLPKDVEERVREVIVDDTLSELIDRKKPVRIGANYGEPELYGAVAGMFQGIPVKFALAAPIKLRDKERGLLLILNRTIERGAELKQTISDLGQKFLNMAVQGIETEIQKKLLLVDLSESIDQRRKHTAQTSHLLTSHMHAIYGEVEYLTKYADELPHDVPNKRKMCGLARKIFQHAKELDHKSKTLAYYSTEESSRLRLRHDKKFLLVKLLRECIDRFKYSAEMRGIKITLRTSGGSIPPLFADRDRLEIAFLNIIDNAVKYSFDGREIGVAISVDDSEGYYDVAVSDFGVGILPQERVKIFEPGYRARVQDPSRFLPGTGLGLAVAKEIIGAHGGKIWVMCSQGELKSGKKSLVRGFNTTFFVRLKLKRK